MTPLRGCSRQNGSAPCQVGGSCLPLCQRPAATASQGGTATLLPCAPAWRRAAGVRTSSVSLLRRSTDPSGWELPRIWERHDRRRNRLFSRREEQGAPSEVLEVGDLSRWENKP